MVQELFGVQGARPAQGPPDVFGQQVPQRLRIGLHPGARFRADARSRGEEQVLHRVFVVISVSAGGGHGIPDFSDLGVSDGDGGHELGHVLQGENVSVPSGVEVPVVVQPFAGEGQEDAGEASQKQHALHLNLFRGQSRILPCKVPENYPSKQNGDG